MLTFAFEDYRIMNNRYLKNGSSIFEVVSRSERGILFTFMATACSFCLVKLLLMLLQDPIKNDSNNLKDLVSSINDNLSVFMLI